MRFRLCQPGYLSVVFFKMTQGKVLNEVGRATWIGKRASFMALNYIMESLILAQNERWRRVLSMQVER